MCRDTLGLVVFAALSACSSAGTETFSAAPVDAGALRESSAPEDAGASPTLPIGNESDAGVPRDAAAPPTNTIVMTVRDFKKRDPSDPTAHPDFESPDIGDDRDMVLPTLGGDRKPVYRNATGTTRTTNGKERFDQWYRDVPGVNQRFEIPLLFERSASGTYVYDSDTSGVRADGGRGQFFPIDGRGFGNQGFDHNFHFTGELHTRFTYRGGEVFRFRGDDDVWVFIDGARVIDLGGTHGAQEARVELDTLPLTKGRDYPLDFFFAERHTGDSNLLIETSIVFAEFEPPR